MELGELIEYFIRNIFLKKSYTKCGGEAIPRPFSKKNKIEHILWFVFIVCQAEGYQNILKLSWGPPAFISYESFLKKQKEFWS